MIPRSVVKLAVPAAGTLGLYAGGLLGVLLVSRAGQPVGGLTQFFWSSALALAFAFGALLGAEKAIGPEAAHVDTLKTLFYMSAAALAMFAEHTIGERWAGRFLPAFVENLAIWAAGVAAIREGEPGFVSWTTELGSLTGRPRG